MKKNNMTKDLIGLSVGAAALGAGISAVNSSQMTAQKKNLIGTTLTGGYALHTAKKLKLGGK